MSIYLYVKIHNITGLKYLGKTVSSDPHKYKGSGIYWKNHIKTHGYNVTTIILKECQHDDEIKDWGLYYSNLWNIVDARDSQGQKIWANFKPETGDGGSVEKMPDEVKLKISSTMKGRPAHNKGKKQLHKPHKPRRLTQFGNPDKKSKLSGRPRSRVCCIVCQKEVDVANLARYHCHT